MPYFLFRCDSALPAADLDAVLVRPSRSTFEAAAAVAADVTSRDFVCVSALPAALFEAFPVSGLRSVCDAALAAAGLVDLGFDMTLPPYSWPSWTRTCLHGLR